jgi:hypothetical protein
LLLWPDQHGRVANGGFVWWLVDAIISSMGEIPNLEQRLNDREKLGDLLSYRRLETLQDLKKDITRSVQTQKQMNFVRINEFLPF